MTDRILEQIFAGSVVALVTALINQSVQGRISYLWIIAAFIVGAVLYSGFRALERSPFKKYRVGPDHDGTCLLAHHGRRVGQAWQFHASETDWAVYGPYLRQSLRKGRYRAAFRVKIDNVSSENRPIAEVDVAARSRDLGDKRLAGRVLTTADFATADQYEVFPLDFYTRADERDLELRIFTKGSDQTVTLDYVRLSRRLL